MTGLSQEEWDKRAKVEIVSDEEYRAALRFQAGTPEVKLNKLDIRDGYIHYFLRQQDGSMFPMKVKDTTENRVFVTWVQIHDGPSGKRNFSDDTD